jgi:membrane protein DedA with SNARE-associated domain
MYPPLVATLLYYRYGILIPLAVIEGPFVMLIAGFVVRLGGFDFIPAYFCLLVGDFIADMGWYLVGYFWGMKFVRRWGKYVNVSEENIKKLEHFFHHHSAKILIISKLTMGFGFAVVTLIAAGLVKIPFKKYFLLNLIGGFIWTAVLMGIGYFFGNAYVSVNNIFERVSIVALFIIILTCLFGFGKYLGKRFVETS